MKKALLIFVVMAFVAAFADNPHITKLIELTDVLISTPANGDVLTYDATSATWQNKQPATPQGPQIVARFQVVNQTGNVATTDVFTPDSTGNYRLNYYSEAQGFNGNSCPTFTLVWTDDNASVPTFNSTPIACGGNPFSEPITVPFRSVANAPVTFSMSNPSAWPVSVYITVEKL